MILAKIALIASALLAVLALVAHYRATARTRRLGGFYVVPEPTATERAMRAAELKPRLKVIEGGKL